MKTENSTFANLHDKSFKVVLMMSSFCRFVKISSNLVLFVTGVQQAFNPFEVFFGLFRLPLCQRQTRTLSFRGCTLNCMDKFVSRLLLRSSKDKFTCHTYLTFELPFRKSKLIFFEIVYKSENYRRYISHITEVREDNSFKKLLMTRDWPK